MTEEHGYTASNARPTTGDVTIEGLHSHLQKLHEAFLIDVQCQSRLFRTMTEPMFIFSPEMVEDLKQAARRRILPICDYNIVPLRYVVLPRGSAWPAPNLPCRLDYDYMWVPPRIPAEPFVPAPWRAHEVITLLVFGVTVLLLLAKAMG